ncbi:hypothetical protein [Natrinema limicola]|uniref:hypothetical protein n=1 Tax=Natrinema limicola TaxID=370323 RepID=UPI001F4CF420|nr:hypothetical protein [Natrinema limicola]
MVPTAFSWIQHGLIGGWVLAPGYQRPVAEAMAAAGNSAAIAKVLQITRTAQCLQCYSSSSSLGYIITALGSAVCMLSALTLSNENPNPRNRA